LTTLLRSAILETNPLVCAIIDNPTCAEQQILISATRQIVLAHARQSFGVDVAGAIASAWSTDG